MQVVDDLVFVSALVDLLPDLLAQLVHLVLQHFGRFLLSAVATLQFLLGQTVVDLLLHQDLLPPAVRGDSYQLPLRSLLWLIFSLLRLLRRCFQPPVLAQLLFQT